MSPLGLSLRDAWEVACGAMDRDVRNRAGWMQMLGQRVTPADLIEMHPLRRMYRPQPTAAEQKAAGEFGFACVTAALKELNKQKRGGV